MLQVQLNTNYVCGKLDVLVVEWLVQKGARYDPSHCSDMILVWR